MIKDPRQRLRDAGDARIEIDEIIKAPGAPLPAVEKAPTKGRWPLFATATAAMVLLAIVSWLINTRQSPGVVWAGAQLGGPSVGIRLRASPDGKLVAFQAMVDNLTQVAVMQPDTGDWTVLTHDRSRGYLTDVSWSPDSSRIYYGRIDGTPKGIFAVSPLGGDERLVLEDAKSAESLPDGSLLVIRINADRRDQLFRFWPDTARLQPYAVFPESGERLKVRAVPGGREVLFIGRTGDQPASDTAQHLYALDLNSSDTRRVDAPSDIDAFAPTPDGDAVIATVRTGDVTTLLRISRRNGRTEPLMPLTNVTSSIDVTRDGSMYVEQSARPLEVLRWDSATGSRQTIATFGNAWFVDALPGGFLSGLPGPTPLPDGRVIVPTHAGGRTQLVAVKDGSEPSRFAQTTEETSTPMTLLGTNEVAFIAGSGGSRQITVASVADGRIIRRLSNIDGRAVARLAASPDGRTLYYVQSGKVWSVPSAGGEPRFIREGDSVAADPSAKYLVIQLNEKDDVRLVRVPLDGQPEEPLTFPGVRLTYLPLLPNAVRADGVIVKGLALSDSFFFALGLLHPDTGKVDRIVLPALDVHYPGFAPDGRIVVSTYGVRSALWRFKPAS